MLPAKAEKIAFKNRSKITRDFEWGFLRINVSGTELYIEVDTYLQHVLLSACECDWMTKILQTLGLRAWLYRHGVAAYHGGRGVWRKTRARSAAGPVFRRDTLTSWLEWRPPVSARIIFN